MGVYVGVCFSESEKTWFYEKLQLSGFGITGCCRAMLANRISYSLGAKGPSFAVDTACSSSMFALKEAYDAVRSGEVECALVGGTNLVLHPYVSLQFMRLGVLSKQGICRPMDDDGNGYVRAEAIAAVFLQRAKDARRVYATMVNAAVNCDGYKEQGITYPSGQAQAELMRDTCRDAGVDPGSLAYVEAHATGTRAGDPEELAALDKVYSVEPGRKEPLLIGSVKSNLGHAEPVSGLVSVTKVILAMESGVIPPTIHYKRPRRGVAALKEGRLKDLRELLRAQESWEARVRLCAQSSTASGLSAEYKMAALDALYARILSPLRYTWPSDRPRLRASVTLIRPAVSALPPGFLPEDYGLSQICERPVRVHYVEGADHYTLPSKRQTAALVNAALEVAHRDLGIDYKTAISSPRAQDLHGLKSLRN